MKKLKNLQNLLRTDANKNYIRGMKYLTHDEELEQEAYDHGVIILEKYNFKSPRIKGLYSNNVIALSKSIKSKKEKACILAEELSHHYITVGDITDETIEANRKQEYKARLLSYDKKVGLTGIIKAYENGCLNIFEMAEYLDVTESFLQETLKSYKSKYGEYIKIDNYIVYFEPNIGVFKFI